MLISATLSKPTASVKEALGRDYEKIKIKIENSASGTGYFAEMFTKTQVFHKHFSEEEARNFIEENAGKTFKNCVQRTESEEITILTNKKGKISRIVKKIGDESRGNAGAGTFTGLGKAVALGTANSSQQGTAASNRATPGTAAPLDSATPQSNRAAPLSILPPPKKHYILQEGQPVPFLVLLGVMTPEGKVIKSKYDKFRQINRFLEFIDDILPELLRKKPEGQPLRVVDFGCGKSYLTFAIHYFLTVVRGIPCQIEGLDLKEEVIAYCNDMAKKLGLEGLVFHTGNIADYSGNEPPDLVITLHACDTATDFALKYAVEKGAGAILSVPCCQHQVNKQLGDQSKSPLFKEGDFAPLLKWGIIREKFSSLVTDALRGEWLESQGYKVQMLEFIDMEHTPKNILIRATAVERNRKTESPQDGSLQFSDGKLNRNNAMGRYGAENWKEPKSTLTARFLTVPLSTTLGEGVAEKPGDSSLSSRRSRIGTDGCRGLCSEGKTFPSLIKSLNIHPEIWKD